MDNLRVLKDVTKKADVAAHAVTSASSVPNTLHKDPIMRQVCSLPHWRCHNNVRHSAGSALV